MFKTMSSVLNEKWEQKLIGKAKRNKSSVKKWKCYFLKKTNLWFKNHLQNNLDCVLKWNNKSNEFNQTQNKSKEKLEMYTKEAKQYNIASR